MVKGKGLKSPGGAKNPGQAGEVVASEVVAQDLVANNPQGDLKAAIGVDATYGSAKLNVSETRQQIWWVAAVKKLL
jgi:hypothetical protein